MTLQTVKWRPGLRESIALTVVLMTVTATGAMAIVAYQLQAGPARERFSASAQAGFMSDAEQANKHQATNPLQSKVDRVADYMTGRYGLSWSVVNLQGTSGPVSELRDGAYAPVASKRGMADPVPVAEVDQAIGGGPVAVDLEADGDPQRVVIGEVSPRLLLVEYYSLKKLDAELSTLRGRLAGIAGGVSVLAAFGGVFAARRIQRRVRTAAVAARKLGEGALDTRLPVQGNDELADLAGSFNAMAGQLGESIEQLRVKDQQQRRFVADVAHDLRTPLASMIAATESLHSPLAEDRERSAELLGTQVRRLSTLVDDLLEMSRFDAGAADLRPEPVELDALVEDAVALSAPDEDVRVRQSGNVTVFADPRRLHTIMRNLVTNAVRHGAAPVTVTLDGRDPDRMTIAVADSGPGLPPELAPFVFDRFVRGDHARSHTEGSGLGLAIVAENAALHGGRIEVVNSGGAVFILTLPRGHAGL